MLRKFIFLSLFYLSALHLSAKTPDRHLTLKDTIKDMSIQIPQELERNIDQMLVDWKNTYRQPVDCNQHNSKAITYPDSYYIDKLYNYPSEMELAYNQIVRSYIDMYASRRSTSVQYMLSKGKYYFPFIEEVLDKYKLPLELKYLPVIESALNPVAVSRAGATGLWQFMLRTGKMYDLEVNSLVDERRDPVKATEAAARYLKDLYDIYGDWNLVIAAYNCGPGNVNKAIRRSGGQTDYWAIYHNLPKETRGYVPAFIAATYIMNFYSDHNICPMEYIYPVSVDTILIEKNLHFQQVSDILNIPIEEIRDLNPQYKKDIIPGGERKYSLCLPSQTIGNFITYQDTIFNHNSQKLLAHRKTVEVAGENYTSGKVTKTHKIKKGESLGSIAKRYGVTVTQLKRLNNLRSNNITAGKTLVIRKTVSAPVKETAQQPTVKKEENLKQLAANITEEDEMQDQEDSSQANPSSVPDEDITVDRNVDGFFARYYKNKDIQAKTEEPVAVNDVPKARQEPQHATGHAVTASQKKYSDNNDRTVYHKVKIGENISVIAKRYDVSPHEIISWNNLPSKRVSIGQQLMIKLPEEKEIINELAMEIKENDNVSPANENVQAEPTKKAPKRNKTYRVRKGDSLYLIAKKFGKITAQDIKLANNLKSDRLSIGQVLKIPIN